MTKDHADTTRAQQQSNDVGGTDCFHDHLVKPVELETIAALIASLRPRVDAAGQESRD